MRRKYIKAKLQLKQLTIEFSKKDMEYLSGHCTEIQHNCIRIIQRPKAEQTVNI